MKMREKIKIGGIELKISKTVNRQTADFLSSDIYCCVPLPSELRI